VGGSGVVEVVPLPPVKLNPVSTAILDAFKASKTLHVVATAQFAIQIAAYVDESGQMPAGRDLADVLAALRQADESEVRDRAIGEDARNQRALAGLVLSKVKKSRRGDSERAKAADSPHGTVSTSGIVHGPAIRDRRTPPATAAPADAAVGTEIRRRRDFPSIGPRPRIVGRGPRLRIAVEGNEGRIDGRERAVRISRPGIAVDDRGPFERPAAVEFGSGDVDGAGIGQRCGWKFL
jgi:hypothetical protein